MADPINGHTPMPINHRERMRCAVCKLEEKWIDRVGIPKAFGAGSRQQRHMAMCSKCGITAHSLPVPWNRRIFNLQPLRGLSCFQIAHHNFCDGLWFPKGVENTRTLRQGRVIRSFSYRVSLKHPIYCHLMDSYGLGHKLTRNKRSKAWTNQETNSNEDEEFSIHEEEEENSNEDDSVDKENTGEGDTDAIEESKE